MSLWVCWNFRKLVFLSKECCVNKFFVIKKIYVGLYGFYGNYSGEVKCSGWCSNWCVFLVV